MSLSDCSPSDQILLLDTVMGAQSGAAGGSNGVTVLLSHLGENLSCRVGEIILSPDEFRNLLIY